VAEQQTVVLIGTLDTKGAEYAFLVERLRAAGVRPLLVDVGTYEPHGAEPDIGRDAVAAEAGVDLAALAEGRDRGAAVTAMAGAAAALVRRLRAEGRCDGVLAAGGSGNTAIATAAMRALPVGVPKLMVSTVAAGDTTEYIGASDLTLMASVADVAGVNSISGRILANAAAAMAGMVQAPPVDVGRTRTLIGATMFGVTTPCVTAAREELERRGYEVPTFDATGAGGRAMEDQLRGARDGARALRRAPAARAQPAGHAHAHDATGVRRAGPADRGQAVGRAGPRRAVPASARGVDDLDRRRAVL
jgi:uncharacterized protein (UPF0261 family)